VRREGKFFTYQDEGRPISLGTYCVGTTFTEGNIIGE
jgi:hypothetical protein